jgi:integrase
MATLELPRGIQIVKWKTDAGPQERFRVRIQRKNLKADELFESLADALKFLADSKSPRGRIVLQEEQRQRDAIALQLAQAHLQFNLRGYMTLWEDEHLPTIKAVEKLPYAEKKRAKNERSRTRTICEALVEYQLAHDLPETLAITKIWPTGKFGDLKLGQLSTRTALSYIQSRRANGGGKTVSYSTIKRDLAFLSVFFAWLRAKYPDTKKSFEENPFESEEIKGFFRKKTVSKEIGVLRDVTFDSFGEEAENRLFEELRKCRNPQMVQIVALALATGQRRGEIIDLTWDRVFPDHIRLRETDTKNSKPREVFLYDDAKKILASVEKKEGQARVFTYTHEGFKSVWGRVRERAGLEGLRFHDLRHIFVARLVTFIASPVAAASVAGFRSVAHFERAHFTPAKDRAENRGGLRTEKGLRRTLGHADARMTAAYAGDVASEVVKATDAAKKPAPMVAKRYPVLLSAENDIVTLYAPDFGLATSGATYEEALAAMRAAAKASGENPEPSKPLDVAKENPGAGVKIVEI